MGLDFLSCDICSDNFPDCIAYFSCNCGGTFCSNECAKMDFAAYDEDGEVIEGEESEGTCVLCRGEEATDRDLVKWLLARCNLTREQAVELMHDKPEDESEEVIKCDHGIPLYGICIACDE